MQVLVDLPWENAGDWLAELKRQAPHHDLHRSQGETSHTSQYDPQQIEAAVLWAPKADLFCGMSRLKAIIVPGAGVDQLWRHGGMLPDVPIIRLADPLMANRMAEYVLAMVLDHHRGLGRYRQQQQHMSWARHPHADPGDIRIGILGLGMMGAAAARYLTAVGYDVTGWSRRPKVIDKIKTVAGDLAFNPLLEQSNILICLLPLTRATHGILNAANLARLPEGAMVINAARGGHMVVSDLIDALNQGKLAHAVLDVFEDEPLPATSPLWRHPNVTLTPHVASLSNPVSGAQQIVRALGALEVGKTPDNIVDQTAGY